ncbi:hypothetical protein COLO4_06458 [Corchorus olitorius]|uniref:Uncharacterized protein n=1 Tax=Corchorus olitorius TaxID=93759 RepID=A0A1R3KMZ8_9ROSI|nr:hypothetical protein COLO4_06458 [Corchorus olitorius]
MRAATMAMAPVPRTNMGSPSEDESELRRGPWTLEEDTLLTHYIARHGEGRWNMLAKCAVRCFWMPRLLQKVEQTSSTSYSPSSFKEMTSSQSSSAPYYQLSENCTSNNIPSMSTTFPPLPINSNHYSFENSSPVTSQSLYPPDFMNISEQSEQIPQHLTSPNVSGHATFYNNQNLYQSYNIDSSGYHDMEEGFSLASMSAVGPYEGSPSDCQMAQGNWVSNEMTDALWSNMDDIWQFRELGGEMGNQKL